MRNDLPVNFETFYFFNLLDQIEESGKESYDDVQLNHLKQFLDYLSESDTASSSIEKLIRFKSTSDLSIFFSDILEHIKKIKPDNAIEKISTYSIDFLEMFKVLIKDEEWESYFEKMTAQDISDEQPSEMGEELSFREYCEFVVDSKIKSHLPDIPVEQQPLFKELLQTILKEPSLTDRLQKKIQNEKVSEFVSLKNEIFDGHTGEKNIEEYIQNFDSTVEEWSMLFKEIFEENRTEMQEILLPEVAEKSEPEHEITVELFEKVEEPFGTEEIESSGDDIDNLMERMEKRQKEPEDHKFSNKEKDRRKLLKDYIVGEVASYKEELLSSLQNLLKEEGDIQSENKLLEDLKYFKDLGQIHSYMGIELAGAELLKLFESLFRNNKSVSPQMLKNIENIFQILPDYISSSISAESEKHISDIRNELGSLGSNIGEEDQISLQHETTLKETYNEILDRKIRIIKGKLDEKPLPQWDDNDIVELSSTLDNIFFWSNVLKLNQVVNAISLLKQLLLTPTRESLTQEDVHLITQFIDFLVREYSNTDNDLWNSAINNLKQIQYALDAVPITEATVAFEEVTKRYIIQLLKEIEQSKITSIDIFIEALPTFFYKLNLNASLIGNQDLKSSATSISNLLDEINPYLSAVQSDETEQVKPYLEELADQFDGAMNKTVNFDRFTNYLQDLQKRLAEPSTEGIEDFDTITDDDIQLAFESEAKKYMDTVQNNITELEKEDNKDLWSEVGVALHTLKGSAQMVGRSGVYQLAKTFEELSNLIKEEKIPKNEESFKIMKEVIESIRKIINEPDYFSDELNERFQNYSKSLSSEKSPEKPEQVSKEAAFLSEDELIKEEESTELIELEEHDPELLQIFNDEVSNNIKLVDQHLDSFEKFAYDKSMMQDVDRAVHEICSAAKMLGLSEIGDLAERLEQVIDLIYQQKITDIKDKIPLLRKGMLVIRELTLHRKIEQNFYEEVEEEIELILEGIDQPGQPEKQMEMPVAQEGKPEGVTSQVWEAFFQEAAELSEDINYLVLELEKNPDNKELKHHLMRSMHTLKGSAAMVYANKIETLAHLSEEVFEKYSKQDLTLTTDVFDLLLQVLDEINYILSALKTFQQEDTQNFEEINEKLNQYIKSQEKEDIDKDAETIEAAKTELPKTEPPKVEPQAKKIEKDQSLKAKPTEQTYIRLNIDQMNHLLNLAAELVISHTQFKNQLDELKGFSPALDMELKLFDETKGHLDSILELEQKIQETLSSIQNVQPGVQESVKNQLINIQKILSKFQAFQSEIDKFSHSLKDSSITYDENIQKLNKLSNELLDEIIQARLVPIQLLFKRFQRPIRDMSHQFGKKIKLVIKGEDTELDRSLVEELYNPLIHIIRNAIDHGIEGEKERRDNNKNPEGTLEINAYRDRNQVTIEIKDDGRGIDHDKVKKLALEKELVTPNDIEGMSEHEVLELLFYPGFSTMEEATLVSGRGVGLDAVKSDLEKIKGDIRVYSEMGEGTTFVIRVPISLSVIQSMLVTVADHTYSIPLSQVEETLNIETKDFIQKNDGFFLPYKAKEIPLVLLSQLLGLQDSESSEDTMQNKKPVIITFDHGNYVALLVDNIVRREEILIKSLGPTLKRLKYFTGGSIMADGRVVLVIDVPQIIQEIIKTKSDSVYGEPIISRQKRDTKRISMRKKKDTQKIIEDRKPSILVVDDSLSVRKYLNGLLSEKGFSISTARNGLEGLNLLKDKKFDLIITDLEMPQVSGYELIETIRSDDQHNDTPIIVLTGRASEDFRNLTTELGANAYIIKPFKDQELFDEIDQYIRFNE